MDTVAQRMANLAAEMVGRFTDTPFATWEHCTEAQKEWWRELARVSQEPKPAKATKAKD